MGGQKTSSGAMNRKLWENLASLYGVHAFNYLIPLFTLPYLARVLGPEMGSASLRRRLRPLHDPRHRVWFRSLRHPGNRSHPPRPAARGRQLAGVFGAQLLLRPQRC